MTDPGDRPNSQDYSFDRTESAQRILSVEHLVPQISRPKLTSKTLIRHLRLVPFDILVLLFIGAVMMPVWAAALLVAVNVGTWWCYHRIPQFLRTVSGPEGHGVYISGSIVEDFARFIQSCGVHHRSHYGLMFAMMAGFHMTMSHSFMGMAVPDPYPMILAWAGFAGLFMIDFYMYWVSLRTLQELRRDKLAESNRYAEELQRSNEDLEQFAYIASHDLRAPLRGMINLATWIDEDIQKDTEESKDLVRYHVSLLKSRIRRMDSLLNDLLQYARIGRHETEHELIDLNALTREIFDSLHVGDRMSLNIQSPPVRVEDYRITYFLILSNLIGNAIKHNDKDHGNIWVDFSINGSRLTMIVEDDGPGIPLNYRSKVFEVFATLERRDEKEATGMGLAIIKKIVDHKKGAIVLDENEQGGARFKVTLPLLPTLVKE